MVMLTFGFFMFEHTVVRRPSMAVVRALVLPEVIPSRFCQM